MLDFCKFYNDIYFIYALFKENYLKTDDIKKIADKLVIYDDNKYLIDILISENNDDVITLFDSYLKDKNIYVKSKNRNYQKNIWLYIE